MTSWLWAVSDNISPNLGPFQDIADKVMGFAMGIAFTVGVVGLIGAVGMFAVDKYTGRENRVTGTIIGICVLLLLAGGAMKIVQELTGANVG